MAVRRLANLRPLDATISAEEAASLLGLSRAAVYKDLAVGNIPSKRRGSRYVIYRADVERLLTEGTTAAKAQTETLPRNVVDLLSALAGEGEITFEVTIRRKNKTA